MLKLILSNTFRSKVRLVVIVLTVALSVMLCYSVLSFGDVIGEYFEQVSKSQAGNSEIVLRSNAVKGSNLVNTASLSDLDGVEWCVGSLDAYCSYYDGEYKVVRMRGFKKAELEYLFDVNILEGRFEETADIYEDEIIISDSFAKECDLQVGERITVTLLSNSVNFYVGAIAADDGYFKDDSHTILAVDSRMSSALGWHLGNVFNRVYIRTTGDVETVFTSLQNNTAFKTVTVEMAYDASSVEAQASRITVLFQSTGIILLFLAVLIIFKLQSVQSTERTKLIMRLKVIGTSPNKLVFILLCEELILGGLGAILGGVLSSVAFRAIISGTLTGVAVSTSISKLILSAFAMLLAVLVTGSIPILKGTSQSIRASMVQARRSNFVLNKVPIIVVSIVFIASIIVSLVSDGLRPTLGVVNLVLCVVFLLLCVPYVQVLVAKLLSSAKNGIVAVVGANTKLDGTLLANSQLLLVGVLISLILFQGLSVFTAYSDTIHDYSADRIMVANVGALSEDNINTIASLEGVTESVPLINDTITLSYGDTSKLISVCATDGDGIQTLFSMELVTPSEELRLVLNDVHNAYVVLPIGYNYRDGIAIGDSVDISYKGHSETYTVGGFINTLYENGDILFVNRAQFYQRFESVSCNAIFVKSNNVDVSIQAIRAAFVTEGVEAMPLWSLIQSESSYTFAIFDFYQMVTMLMVFLVAAGVVCNVIISRMSRSREYSQYLLLGMTDKRLVLTGMMEGLACGLPSAILAVAGSALCFKFMADGAMLVDTFITFSSYNFGQAVLIAVLFLVVYTLISPILRIFKPYKVDLESYKNI